MELMVYRMYRTFPHIFEGSCVCFEYIPQGCLIRAYILSDVKHTHSKTGFRELGTSMHIGFSRYSAMIGPFRLVSTEQRQKLAYVILVELLMHQFACLILVEVVPSPILKGMATCTLKTRVVMILLPTIVPFYDMLSVWRKPTPSL